MTGWIVDFIPTYLPTQPTIPKSELTHFHTGSKTDLDYRVLIAMIRNMGECLCPRCLIPKSRVHQIATERDILQRKLLQRCNSQTWRDKIAAARQLIYEKHYAVQTPQVEELLKGKSLVPTLVE